MKFHGKEIALAVVIFLIANGVFVLGAEAKAPAQSRPAVKSMYSARVDVPVNPSFDGATNRSLNCNPLVSEEGRDSGNLLTSNRTYLTNQAKLPSCDARLFAGTPQLQPERQSE